MTTDQLYAAEEALEPNDRVFYITCLFEVLGIDQPVFEREARPNDFYFAVRHATPTQCVKALLMLGKAKGKP